MHVNLPHQGMFMVKYRKNKNLERWNKGIQGEKGDGASVASER
jgi:hypothetical protein